MGNVSDLSRFTTGDCLVLARAIHDATGWPIATFSSEYWPADTHAFVRLPDHRFLDVQGVATEKQMYERWFSWKRLDAARATSPIKTWRTVAELAAVAADWVNMSVWKGSEEIAERVAYKLLWELDRGVR